MDVGCFWCWLFAVFKFSADNRNALVIICNVQISLKSNILWLGTKPFDAMMFLIHSFFEKLFNLFWQSRWRKIWRRNVHLFISSPFFNVAVFFFLTAIDEWWWWWRFSRFSCCFAMQKCKTAFANVKRQIKWNSFSFQHYELKTTETVNMFLLVFFFSHVRLCFVALCVLFRRKKDFKVLIRFGILLLKAYRVCELKNEWYVLPLTSLTSSTSYSIAYVAITQANHYRQVKVSVHLHWSLLLLGLLSKSQAKRKSNRKT